MVKIDLIKKRILVTGANGMLGQRVVEFYSPLNDIELHATSVEDKFVFENPIRTSFSTLSFSVHPITIKKNKIKLKLFIIFFLNIFFSCFL